MPYVHIGLKILLYTLTLFLKLNIKWLPINQLSSNVLSLIWALLPQYDVGKLAGGLNESLDCILFEIYDPLGMTVEYYENPKATSVLFYT